MGRLFTYFLSVDSGLAPNPFDGWCTLAVGAPNHAGIRAEKGDWIAGFTRSEKGVFLVFAMELTEAPLSMDFYFDDPRFAGKKPQAYGTPEERCGDNIYHRDASGALAPAGWSLREGHEETDLRHPFVFVSSRFWYQGADALPLPDGMLYALLPDENHRVAEHQHGSPVTRFRDWVTGNLSPGRNAMPRDFDHSGASAGYRG